MNPFSMRALHFGQSRRPAGITCSHCSSAQSLLPAHVGIAASPTRRRAHSKKPHKIRLGRIHVKALDPISVFRGATRLLDSGAAHFNADASQLIHPPVLVGLATARSIYRHVLMLENERSACNRWAMSQTIGGHNFFISPTVEPEPPPSACVSFRLPAPPGGVQRAPRSPQWRTGASFPREAPFSLEIFIPILF